MAEATLFNPETKVRQAVGGEGQPTSEELFGKGFVLETGFDEATGVSTFDEPAQTDILSSVNVTNEQDINIPPPEEPLDEGESLVAGAGEVTKTIDDFIKENTAPETPEAIETKGFQQEIVSLLGEAEGRSTAQAEAEEAGGIPTLQTDLASVNADLRVKMAEFKAMEQGVEGKAISRRFVQGEQAQIRRTAASELGVLQARALGLQGQISTAQSVADRAVDLKFSTIEAEIRTKQAQINALLPTLNKQEQAFASARLQQLNEEAIQVEEEKTTEKAVQGFAIQAMSNGADSALAEMIQGATSEVDAAQIAGKVGTEEGWEYVPTPARRDELIAQGFELTQAGTPGNLRTYAREPVVEDVETSIVEVEGRKKLVNTQTGETIKDLGSVETVDADGRTDPITGVTSDPTKIIDGFDFTSYATDPNWGNSVNNIFSSIKFDTIEDIDAYIQNKAPGSDVTRADIAEVSEEFGTSWEILTAIMQQESNFGTLGLAVGANNPGNVGTTDQLAAKGEANTFSSTLEGIRAIGRNTDRRRITGGGRISDLTSSQITAGGVLAKQLFGTIKTENQIENFLNPILQRMADGESVDDIADDLRFAGQSPEFTGAIRGAAQQITSKLSAKQTQSVFDKLDDTISSGDQGGTLDFLKKIAIDNAPGGATQAQKILGEERTLELVTEIGEDLKTYENSGGDTNLFAGTAQQVTQKIGEEGNQELAKLANKIQIAIINYRKAISGAAFNELEQTEYRDIFPSTKSTAELNSAKIDSLQDVFGGDVDFFFKFAMGSDNFEQLFEADVTETIDVNGVSPTQADQDYVDSLNL